MCCRSSSAASVVVVVLGLRRCCCRRDDSMQCAASVILGSAVRCHATEVRLVLGPFYLMASRRVCPSDERIEMCRIEPLCGITVKCCSK